jgi:hypothetical protein
MLSCITRRLDSSKYLIGPGVDYPASVGPANPRNLFAGRSEEQSVAMGVRALVAEIRATPNRVGILGYK